jgi:L-amino acid N-acyltransferase YncA
MSLIVRPYVHDDAASLTDLLNAVIARGGTTALEDAFTSEQLADTYLDGPNVHICLVAVETDTGRIEGFQTLGRYPTLSDEIGDIGTFAQIDGTKRGVGSALFAEMTKRARALGLSEINATIRSDNEGGLAFYTKQGFDDHAVTVAVPLKDGTPVDRIHKRYRLIEAERAARVDHAEVIA